MRGHAGRVALTSLVVLGLAVHIGLGYAAGLVVAGVALVGHLVLAGGAWKLVRRKQRG